MLMPKRLIWGGEFCILRTASRWAVILENNWNKKSSLTGGGGHAYSDDSADGNHTWWRQSLCPWSNDLRTSKPDYSHWFGVKLLSKWAALGGISRVFLPNKTSAWWKPGVSAVTLWKGSGWGTSRLRPWADGPVSPPVLPSVSLIVGHLESSCPGYPQLYEVIVPLNI